MGNEEEALKKSKWLADRLYKACDYMRGSIMRTDYRAYLFPLIFFKRISDVYDEECVVLRSQVPDDEFVYDPENHRFDIPKGCHWKDIRETSVDIGSAFYEASIRIEEANPTTIKGIFSNLDTVLWTDKNVVSDELMVSLIEHFSAIPLGNKDYSSDIIGQAYEYLIKTFADITKKKAGEYYTPRQIVKMMITVLAPQPGDTIYDPACGTGGMLLESMRYMNNYNMSLNCLYGQENQVSTASMCKINLFLHGADDFHMAIGDTLRYPAFHNGAELQKFNVVVANPPFSLKTWGADKWQSDPYNRAIYGIPSDKNGDFAWVQHMICSMDDYDGRMGVVVPDGVVFRGEYTKMRSKMIADNILWCVVKMGGDLFYGAGVNPYILFFKKNKTDDKVRFVDASNIYQQKRGQNYLEDEDVDAILDLIMRSDDVEYTTLTVSNKDIESENYDLSLNKYVKKPVVDTTRPLSEVVSDLESNINQSQKLEAEIIELIGSGDFNE